MGWNHRIRNIGCNASVKAVTTPIDADRKAADIVIEDLVIGMRWFQPIDLMYS